MRSILSVSHRALTALVACMALLLAGSPAFAQGVSRGKVLDTNGEPVIGAAVMVPGTTTGVTTDIDGNFELRVAPGTTLEVSCIGYVAQRVAAAANMTVVLAEDAEMLEETVVIGYGSVKRSDLTSAVAKMDNTSIDDRPMARAEQALQGQLAGVTVMITNAEPGADPQIRVRGAASISAGNNPLYVIDGVPQGNMQGINPNDIASIEVLKDAASAAIYGSRGSNGVIIVTTKQGQKGKPRVNFTATYGIATLERRVDVLSATEWMEWAVKEMDANYLALYPAGSISDDNATRMANLKLTAPSRTGGNAVNYDDRWFKYLSPEMQRTHTYSDPNKEELSMLDWQKEMYRPAGTQNYNVSVSGATDATKYMFSLGYMDQNGLFPASNYKRINLRTNVETKISELFTIGLNIAPSFVINRGSGRGNGKDSQAHRYLSSAPVSGPGVGYNVAYYPNIKYDWAGTSAYPREYNIDIAPTSNTLRLQASTFLRFTPVKEFQIEAMASANYSSSSTHAFNNGTIYNGAWLTRAEGENSTVSHSTSYGINTLLQIVANYNKTFGKHNVAAMLGASAEIDGIGYSTTNNFKNLANDTIRGTFSGNNTSVTPTVSASSITESTQTHLASFFGRVNYNYDGRYIFSASLRRDGYSRFGSKNKWGWFPSASAGWMISNEPFFKESGLDWWNTFKLRVSYGQTGNNGVTQTAAYSTLSQNNYADDLAYRIGSVGNLSLGWEKTHSTDVAFDFGFLRNRIQASIDWYTKTTTDLLYSIPVPATSGMTSTTGNLGSVWNTGVELELNTQNISKRDFTWSTSFNVSYNYNEVKQLGSENTTVYSSSNGAYNVREVGKPLNYFYGLKCIGVWMSQAEIDAYTRETGLVPKYNGTPIVPGDLKHEDVNGDGNISNSTSGGDFQYLGKPTPSFVYGMTNRFHYKNFDASVLFTAQTGGSIYGTLGRAIDRAGMGTQTNAQGWWRDQWFSEKEPGNGMVPYHRSAVKPDADSRFLYKSDYFRVKNLTLGYTIPFKRIIQSARIYASLENLLILCDYYHGYSPEASNTGTGMDYGAYPSARTYTFGLNINF